MIRNMSAAVKFLEKYIPDKKFKHPGKLGLERMTYLAKLLDNPQNNYKTIHVGGTSGKGSTATIIASILSTKYRTGIHTSPHLERINERIQVNLNGKFTEILDPEFANLIDEIKPAVLKMEKSNIGAPSYFEIVTLAAFLCFAKQKADIAIIEVGMGGSFDATNIIKPEIAVLTNVGLDHTEILGETVEEIARDKAGIIKKKIKVISGVKQKSVIKIIESRLRQGSGGQARLSLLGRNFNYKIIRITEKGSYFNYFGDKTYKNLFISLLGVHQVENATLAIRAVEEFGGITEEEIKTGLKQVFMAGRLEIVANNPLVVLDGAHNPDKMRALVTAVQSIWPNKKTITILAIKEDKKAKNMLNIILPISKELILTSFESLLDQGKVLSISPEELNKIILKLKYKGKVTIEEDVKKAIDIARKTSRKEDIILVTGSLYLIGHFRHYFYES